MKLDEKSGAVVVDEKSATNVPSIWAVGDVTNRIALTPVALMEGMAFARNVFGGQGNAAPDYNAIASAVFSSPPMASVGLTEEEAAADFKNLDLYTSSFRQAALPPSQSARHATKQDSHILERNARLRKPLGLWSQPDHRATVQCIEVVNKL